MVENFKWAAKRQAVLNVFVRFPSEYTESIHGQTRIMLCGLTHSFSTKLLEILKYLMQSRRFQTAVRIFWMYLDAVGV